MPRTKPTTSWNWRTKPTTSWTRERPNDCLTWDEAIFSWNEADFSWDESCSWIRTMWNNDRKDFYILDTNWNRILDISWEAITWIDWVESNKIQTTWN